MVVLVDSSRSHTFVNSGIANKLHVLVTPTQPMTVRVANGDTLPCNSEVKNFEWWCQGYTFKVDTKVLQMGAYDLVLGMDWLELYRSMVCDWLKKWIEFPLNNTSVRLQVILPSQSTEHKEMSMEYILKWDKGNDLWAVVLLNLLLNLPH
jgi:hypothetical protein